MDASADLLPAAERGFVLGAALAGAGPEAADRLAGPGAARCRRALEALARGTGEARAAALERLTAGVRAPVPAGIERVHPGWIRRALAAEPAAVVRAVTAGLPPEVAAVADELLAGREDGEAPLAAQPATIRSAATAELQRILFGALAPMVPDESWGPLARALTELPPAALLEAIDRRGAEVLGCSLHGAPPAVVARAAAAVGPPLGSVVVGRAGAAAGAEGRQAARLMAGAVEPAAVKALGAVRAIGLRALARELRDEGGAAPAVVAQRLAPALGEALVALAEIPGET